MQWQSFRSSRIKHISPLINNLDKPLSKQKLLITCSLSVRDISVKDMAKDHVPE